MTLEVGGAGIVGAALETAYATAETTPTTFIPIRSETLRKAEDKLYRMNLRGLADRQDAIQGYYHIEGDVEMEVNRATILPFLYSSRCDPARSGSNPYTYTFTPANVASPSTAAGLTTRKSLSLYVQRNQKPFVYSGMSSTQMAITFNNGLMICTWTMFGCDEEQAPGTATPDFSADQPYGPEDCGIKVQGAERTDIDTATLTINDNGRAENRIKTTGGRAPSFNAWGEREVTATFDHDFETLDDYNTFLNQTVQTIELFGSKDPTNDAISFLINATAVDSYAVNLPGLGDLVRASVAYHGFVQSTGGSGTDDVYTITVKTTADISAM